MRTSADTRPLNAEPDFNPAHILGKVKLDYLDAEAALLRAREQATEARELLPPAYVEELDEFEHALHGRLEPHLGNAA